MLRKHFIIAKHFIRYKADEFAVAVLEKVAKLEDNEEEVAGLVEDAQGRRDLCRF